MTNYWLVGKESIWKKIKAYYSIFYLANTFFKGFFALSEKYVSPKTSKQALTMGSPAEFWSICFTNGIIYNQKNTWWTKNSGYIIFNSGRFPSHPSICCKTVLSSPFLLECQVLNSVSRTPLKTKNIHTKEETWYHLPSTIFSNCGPC